MARYLATLELTSDAFKGFIQNPSDRKEAARPLFDSIGGEIEHYWYSVGENTVYVVFTATEDDVDLQAIIMAVMASGIARSSKMSRIMTAEEGVAAMKKAGEVTYTPPGD